MEYSDSHVNLVHLVLQWLVEILEASTRSKCGFMSGKPKDSIFKAEAVHIFQQSSVSDILPAITDPLTLHLVKNNQVPDALEGRVGFMGSGSEMTKFQDARKRPGW